VDTVSTAEHRPHLRAKLDAAIGAMHRAASAAVLKGDPLADQLHALADSIGALGAIYEASADTQLEIAEKLRTQADAVADDAIERVHASGVGIIDQLAPHLAMLVEQTTVARSKTAWLRVMLGSAAGLLIALALAVGVSYAAGFAAGRSQGEITAHTISAAMAAGPDAASDWASLMNDNDPVQALAICEKSVATDPHGRRYCSMPVWLDPPTKAVPGQ